VPFYLDRHELAGVTAADVAQAHIKDLTFQDRYGVDYVTYWFDDERQTSFCLARAPDREAVVTVHRESHGLVPSTVIEVEEGMVRQFMGGIATHAAGEPYVATAFRAILFTDLEGSTALTQRLGDAGAMSVLRRHDEVVRRALRDTSGSEVKHTGDGIMASYATVTAAIRGGVLIQRTLNAPSEGGAVLPVGVRVGIGAGEPVTEQDDLFGAAVQLAARLCARAQPGTVLVSSAVRDLAVGKGFEFHRRGALRLKGFDEPVRTFEVAWSEPEPATAG
jgi:class 3 adenylate cyclase